MDSLLLLRYGLIQPSSRGRWTKAVVHWHRAETMFAPKKLIVCNGAGCA